MASSRRTPVNENVSTYGAGKDYTEGQVGVWEAATDNDLVAATQGEGLAGYAEGGGGGLWDETNVTIEDATPDSDYWRRIYPAAGEGHSGIPKDDGSVFGFRSTTDAHTIRSKEAYFQGQDLVGKLTINAANTRFPFSIINADESYFIGCIGYDGTNAGAGGVGGLSTYNGTAGETSGLINCLGLNNDYVGVQLFPDNATATVIGYNCSVINNTGDGFYNPDDTFPAVIKNLQSDNNGTDYADGGGGWTATTCGSKDDTSPTVALRGQTYTYLDSGNDNFLSSKASDTIDEGTDLSADGTYAFDDDILSRTRSGTWDTSFHEFVLISGTLDANVPISTASFDGLRGNIGSLDANAPLPTTSFDGVQINNGTLDANAPLPTTSFDGVQINNGSLDANIPLPTTSFDGVQINNGTLDADIPLPTSSFDGIQTNNGSLDANIPIPTASFSGIVGGDIAGTLDATCPFPEASFDGTVPLTTITGSLDATCPIVTSDIIGNVDITGVSGRGTLEIQEIRKEEDVITDERLFRIRNTGFSTDPASEKYRHLITHNLKREPIGCMVQWTDNFVGVKVASQDTNQITVVFDEELTHVILRIW